MTMPKPNRFSRRSSKKKCISRNTNRLPMQRQIWRFSLNRCIIKSDYIRVEDTCLLLSLRPPTFQCRKVDFPHVRSNGFTPKKYPPAHSSSLTHGEVCSILTCPLADFSPSFASRGYYSADEPFAG